MQVTVIATVTAAGGKLPMGWVHKAKTFKKVRQMKIKGDVHSFISAKGWMNANIMIQYMNEIVIPYLKGRPGALVTDEYAAHWTDEVIALAAANNIELIRVPPTTTSQRQPLDCAVFGPFKQIRQGIALKTRHTEISVLDNPEEAVIRASKAWEFITKKTIQQGWIQACPPLKEILHC